MKHIQKISSVHQKACFQKSITLLLVLLIAATQQLLGQVSDDFTDEDLSSNPAWNSDALSNWTIDNGKLRSNSSTASSSFFVSTPSLQAVSVQWEFFVNLQFNTSSTNYVDVYLVSANENLNAAGNNGYFVRIGGTPDEISLYKITGGTAAILINGTDDITNKSNNTLRIKIIRNADDLWTLSRDATGTGESYVEEGSIADNTFTSGNFFGLRITQSTASFFNKHYFDDFYVGDIIVDGIAPQIQSVNVLSSTELDIIFSEELNEVSAETISNYSVNQTVNVPVTAELLTDGKTVHLVFSEAFPNGITSTITVAGVSDIPGNAITSAAHDFLFFQPVPPNSKDIIITEILADPAPVVALPEAEFIELYNRSEHPFDLAGWQFTDGSSIGNLSSLILLPGDYLILSSTSAKPQFDSFGKSMGISPFPSLNNSGDFLVLKDPTGKLIDSVAYLSAWYNDADKGDGGWSLEIVDPDDFCKGALNWKTSVDESGGTPGHQNSVFAKVPDVTGPKLLSASLSAENILDLHFDEALDKVVPSPASFIIEPPITIAEVTFSDDSFSKISLSLFQALDSTVTYSITIENIFDCAGNAIQEAFSNVVFKLDTVKPDVQSVQTISKTEIEIVFSEKVMALSAENIENYSVEGFGHPVSATLQADKKTIRLLFAQPFVNGVESNIKINDVEDLAGNMMEFSNVAFLFFEAVEASFKDIIITEIFADPSPVIGLPEVEFIELFNRSGHPFNFSGWRFSDGSASVNLSSVILLPEEYLILCTQTKTSEFLPKGKTMGITGFPSLNNSGEGLTLSDDNGNTIDSVNYLSTWYKNDDKKDGGWSLELIDPEKLCAASENWTASENENGGTPGQQNSVYAYMPDVTGPKLLSVNLSSQTSIYLEFDEALDIATVSSGIFTIEPSIEIVDISFSDNTFSKISLSLIQPLDSILTYNLTLQNIFDCPGNLIQEVFANATLKLDTISPHIFASEMITPSELQIVFSEKIMTVSAENILNYNVDGSGNPTSVTLQSDKKTIRILFAQPVANGVENTIRISNVQDLAGNTIGVQNLPFMFFESVEAEYKDVIITEIFADPSPVIGLPEVEFVELYNRSDHPFNLSGWTFSDESSGVQFSSVILLPNEYLILCTQTEAGEFLSKGKTLGLTGFPTLNNSGEALLLADATGQKIDSVNYRISWYKDDERKDGGWSLELIDPENLCAESENWIASDNETGGTPGKQNAVFANKPDFIGPRLLSVFPISNNTLLLRFDEKLEKVLPSLENFGIEPAALISNILFEDASLTSLHLILDEELQNGVKYQLNAQNLYDCAGNILQEEFSRFSFALPEMAQAFDIIINEILFNPRPTGVDFVEIYNQSEKFVNLKSWTIANLESDSVVNRKIISEEDFLMEPKAYAVFTEDGNVLKGEYLNGKEDTFIEIDLPSFPDDEGAVVLVNDAKERIDSFDYSDKYHSVFLKDEEGVSLERISLNETNSNEQNWKSASSDTGFATPGYLNSNTRAEGMTDETVKIEPEIFMPITGQPDFTEIKYNFGQGGFVANVKILDRQGREIKILANNELLGTDGFFRWDGDQENGSKARIGAYMVWFEVFDSSGDVKTFRKRVVIAGK